VNIDSALKRSAACTTIAIPKSAPITENITTIVEGLVLFLKQHIEKIN